MIYKKAKEVEDIIKNILMAAGADDRNSERVAEALVSSNLAGIDTHGLWPLPLYIDLIKSGQIIPNAWPEVIAEDKNYALVKGNFTFGHVTAKFSIELAIEKAKCNNICIVSGVQVAHTGRVGEYAEMAAEQKLISIIFSGGFSEEEPHAMPYGGAKRVLHTNPMAMGFPAGNEQPVISDFATTALSGVKIILAKEKNVELPAGCIVDKNGKPTTNPNDFFAGGGHLPFGGHKGYAFMLANEFLGRIFSSADSYMDKNLLGPTMRHSGFTMIVFKPNIFCSYEEYAGKMGDMIKRIREVPPAPRFKEVQLPGDMERKTTEERLKNGIPISDSVWEATVKVAKNLNVDIS